MVPKIPVLNPIVAYRFDCWPKSLKLLQTDTRSKSFFQRIARWGRRGDRSVEFFPKMREKLLLSVELLVCAMKERLWTIAIDLLNMGAIRRCDRWQVVTDSIYNDNRPHRQSQQAKATPLAGLALG